MADVINYDLIFEEQLKGIRYLETNAGYSSDIKSTNKLLRERRTINMGSLCKCGRISWLVNKTIELNGILIVKNINMRSRILKNNHRLSPDRIFTSQSFLAQDISVIEHYLDGINCTVVENSISTLGDNIHRFYEIVRNNVDHKHLIILG